jgi:predicted TIM-barrel fold metal-dependent hydrolase
VDTVDAQIHIWEGSPTGDWDHAFDYGVDFDNPFTAEDAIVAMDAVGVDAAVMSIPPGYRKQIGKGVYRYSNEYAERASERFPTRLASVARYDHHDPEIDDLFAETRQRPGTVGVRVVIIAEQDWNDLDSGAYDALFTSAEKHDVPLMLFVSGRPERAEEIARAHPELQLIIDHFGLTQPPFMAADPEPFQRLPQLLALAKHPNVSVKFSGAPTLSHERYPYSDLWPHLHQVVEAFGPERLMWGSDVTRVKVHHNYAESVNYIRYTDELSESDKELILGGTLRRILRWPAA